MTTMSMLSSTPPNDSAESQHATESAPAPSATIPLSQDPDPTAASPTISLDQSQYHGAGECTTADRFFSTATPDSSGCLYKDDEGGRAVVNSVGTGAGSAAMNFAETVDVGGRA